MKVPGSYHDARASAGHRAHLALTGEKQLACHDCHFITDAGFSVNAVKPCAECHEKQQEHHHPFDGGVAMGCTSCHIFLPVGETTNVQKWGCQRCHVELADGGMPPGPAVGAWNPAHLPPRIAVHTAKCESCHRPHGTPFTKAADCGQCHTVHVSHGKGEKALVADTCMACHPHHSKAADAQRKCTDCHIGGPVPAKAQVKAGALFANGHTACSTCHKPHAFVASEAKPCTSCHDDQPVLAEQKHGACTKCHQPHEPLAAPVSCESCHSKTHVQHPVPLGGRPCLGCHPPHEGQWGAAVPASAKEAAHPSTLAVPCTACHRSAELQADAGVPTGLVHSAKVECLSCHRTPHQAAPKRLASCQTCHTEQAQLVRSNRGHQSCDKCHLAVPHGPPQEPKACLSCHAEQTLSQRGHEAKLQCNSCHHNHSATVAKQCVDCHLKESPLKDQPLPGLHAVAKHQQCSTCHAPHGAQPFNNTKTCRTNCHTQLTPKSHPTPPQQCVSCHLFTEVKP